MLIAQPKEIVRFADTYTDDMQTIKALFAESKTELLAFIKMTSCHVA